jgi:hypothetical protein
VERHLILARSSLQLMLAVALAVDTVRRGGKAFLVFLPELRDAEVFAQALSNWQDSPFARVEYMATEKLQPTGVFKRRWPLLRSALYHHLAASQATTLSVFNDREESGQALLLEAARRFPQIRRQCVEDGAQAYSRFHYRTHHWITRLRQKLQNGWAWADVEVLGTHPLVQAFLALHPALVRPEISRDRLSQFPAEALCSPQLGSFAAELCRRLGWDAQALPDRPALLALNHSDYAKRNPDYASEITCVVESICRLGLPLLYKYHPRECEPDYLNLASRLGPSHEIPRSMPTECVFLQGTDRPMLVLGGISTALLTARLLMCPDSQVVSLNHSSSAGDAWDETLLKELRIQSVAGGDALCGVLTQWQMGRCSDVAPAARV